jgi:hypothetical protein
VSYRNKAKTKNLIPEKFYFETKENRLSPRSRGMKAKQTKIYPKFSRIEAKQNLAISSQDREKTNQISDKLRRIKVELRAFPNPTKCEQCNRLKWWPGYMTDAYKPVF